MFILDCSAECCCCFPSFFVLLSISCLLPSALIVSRMGFAVCVCVCVCGKAVVVCSHISCGTRLITDKS